MSSEDFELAPMAFTGHQDYEKKVAKKFNQLSSLNVNDKTEKKNGLTYLSWSNAWLEFKKVYPTATYNVVKNPQTGLPYFVDPAVGIMVFTFLLYIVYVFNSWREFDAKVIQIIKASKFL